MSFKKVRAKIVITINLGGRETSYRKWKHRPDCVKKMAHRKSSSVTYIATTSNPRLCDYSLSSAERINRRRINKCGCGTRGWKNRCNTAANDFAPRTDCTTHAIDQQDQQPTATSVARSNWQPTKYCFTGRRAAGDSFESGKAANTCSCAKLPKFYIEYTLTYNTCTSASSHQLITVVCIHSIIFSVISD